MATDVTTSTVVSYTAFPPLRQQSDISARRADIPALHADIPARRADIPARRAVIPARHADSESKLSSLRGIRRMPLA